MKHILFITVLFIFTCSNSNGQIGDIQLDNIQNRKYIKVVANPELKGNGLKNILIGKNYRKEWTAAVNVPVLDFSKDFGGLKPVKAGGGKQTRSLELKDAAGREWALRSVRKFPEQGMDSLLEGTIAESLVSDGISASYPFAVLSVGTIAKAAGIPYFPNTLVYIPDDPALGEHREVYKNLLAFLELRTIDNDPEKKTDGTEEIVPELLKKPDLRVDERAVLRARILDNFIMDFDRHDGQWDWAKKDSAGLKYLYPIPKDRDQAYFDADGLIPWIVSGRAPMGPIQGLQEDTRDILTFNYSQRDFDRFFLTGIDEMVWREEIDKFLRSITDEVIDEALSRQPEEVRKHAAGDIASILKSKRSSLKQDLLDYYQFLSEVVSIRGSNENEKIVVTQREDGRVSVTVSSLSGNSNILYSRAFDPSVTREIRIYGLEGDDQFTIDNNVNAIKFRLIGGPGEDQFTANENKNNVLVYDVSFEENKTEGDGLRNRISGDPMNNEFRRLGNHYDLSNLGIFFEFSFDGGLLIGPSLRAKNFGFRKDPYASNQLFYVTRAVNSSSYHMHYQGEFINALGKTDLLLNTDLQLPTTRTNFYGFGNNTVKDENKSDHFYKVRYSNADASLLLRHDLNNWLQLSYGPVFRNFRISDERNKEKYIAGYNNGLFPDQLYDAQTYLGGEVRVGVNRKNNKVITTRGIHMDLYGRPLMNIAGSSENLTQVGGILSLYTDLLMKDRIIIATSFGADHNIGDFHIPQAHYLGFRQNLRGYLYQRFAGRTRAYNNTELRMNLGNVNLYLAKGPFGIFGFHDMARVWVDDETSDTWHKGYGGGVWMAPFNKIVVTAAVTSSKEEKFVPLMSFGFQF